jgi:glycerophosphocholine phosphodiesterase GPCPD1
MYLLIKTFFSDQLTVFLLSDIRLKFKQNKYPVLFLTQGMTKKWQPFKDRRNSSIEMATYFALSMDLDGINVHAEDIIENRSLIKFVKSKNLVLFCWGEDLNRKELISELKKEGVDGVIYDKYVFIINVVQLNCYYLSMI